MIRLIALFLALWLAASAVAAELYKPELGPALVATQLGRLPSADGETLIARFTAPLRSADALPLIVWSHGRYGGPDDYAPLVRHWASHGYAVIQPAHGDSRIHGTDTVRDRSQWRERVADIVFILDNVAMLEALVDIDLDETRIGVAGHSYGAHTAQIVSGARTLEDGEMISYADPRPIAFQLFSPNGSDGLFVVPDTWSQVRVPGLHLTGTLDEGRNGDPWTWRLEPLRNAPTADKFLFVIAGGRHNFGGITGHCAGLAACNDDHQRWTLSASIAFWDAYLRDDPVAHAWIRSHAMGPATDGQAALVTADEFLARQPAEPPICAAC